LPKPQAAINDYAARGWAFYAPNVIVGEVLFALCKKLQDGFLTQTDDDDAVESFADQMQMILPPPGGASLPDCVRQRDSQRLRLQPLIRFHLHRTDRRVDEAQPG
jgi:hypothetical protein